MCGCVSRREINSSVPTSRQTDSQPAPGHHLVNLITVIKLRLTLTSLRPSTSTTSTHPVAILSEPPSFLIGYSFFITIVQRESEKHLRSLFLINLSDFNHSFTVAFRDELWKKELYDYHHTSDMLLHYFANVSSTMQLFTLQQSYSIKKIMQNH